MADIGPISARAEEPQEEAARQAQACGKGLSPLARRNLVEADPNRLLIGPISARAEEPPITSIAQELVRAYLRSRGGTDSTFAAEPNVLGLSPLARRNLDELGRMIGGWGPISARAEEPTIRPRRLRWRWAYLRSRGGTDPSASVSPPTRGLSPLARRNPPAAAAPSAPIGPISARAEEPLVSASATELYGAYLRSRGGTRSGYGGFVSSEGLSPLARRNRCIAQQPARKLRPISARAEEPACLACVAPLPGAYLRSRGGTWSRRWSPPDQWGLSPLARRNLAWCSGPTTVEGPISARAEEPNARCLTSRKRWAYLRSRGGTIQKK